MTNVFIINKKSINPLSFVWIFRKFQNQKVQCIRKNHHDYRILSGIQPTGSIHLGNYFGAIKQWVDLQTPQSLPPLLNDDDGNDKDNFNVQNNPKYLPPIYQIVDLHSLTTLQDPKILKKNIMEITSVLLGCGIDPDKCILFKQSSVPYHGHLCWILSTFTTLPQLNRFPQFKEKSLNFKEPPTGLFLYPVLQSSDILLYKGTHIPIGDDQLAHINLTKHLTAKFNNTFKRKIFPIPLEIISKNSGASRIKSLRTPEKKMSKSELDQKSCINLVDNSDDIKRKILKSVTDMKSEITYDPEQRPGVSNLLQIYSLITDEEIPLICQKFSGKNTHEFKLELAELSAEYLKPITKKIHDYQSDYGYLDKILKDGNQKAMKIAIETISHVHKTIGID